MFFKSSVEARMVYRLLFICYEEYIEARNALNLLLKDTVKKTLFR